MASDAAKEGEEAPPERISLYDQSNLRRALQDGAVAVRKPGIDTSMCVLHHTPRAGMSVQCCNCTSTTVHRYVAGTHLSV